MMDGFPLGDPKTVRSVEREQIHFLFDRCESAVSGWFVGILFNMFVIATMSSLGLWFLGIPLPLANGLIAGLLTFLPNIGPTISIIPPVAIALISSPIKAASVVGLYIIIQQVESNILTPTVMRQQISMLPAVTLLAQVFFAIFFGFMGLLLALPLALVAQICLEELWLKPVLDKA